jgi:hypothetical protein
MSDRCGATEGVVIAMVLIAVPPVWADRSPSRF